MILTKEDIEKIADYVITDFKKEIGINSHFTPIEKLANDYFKLPVTFEKLSDDSGFCGVTAYNDTKFKTFAEGKVKLINISKGQIILDSDFMREDKKKKLYGKCRFTLAHEVAHQILFQLESDEEKLKYEKKHTKRIAHTTRKLKSFEDWNEWQANTLGAALLMPRGEVEYFIKRYIDAEKTCCDLLCEPFKISTNSLIDVFSSYFQVSKAAAQIRLKEFGYIEKIIKPLSLDIWRDSNV